MKPEGITKSIQLKDGREISIETGRLAKQADGAVVVKMGKTMILATAVSKTEPLEGADFMPLSVDYQEKFAAAGKIPGGFLKREGRLSDYEILVSRLVDRILRPMFPDDYHADTQINLSLISADEEVFPDALAALAASAALSISDIPFNGPISEVRVIKLGDEYHINPTPKQITEASLDLMVGASYDNIAMVEGESKEVSEGEMLEALKVAHEAIKEQCILQKDLVEAIGSIEKRKHDHEVHDEELKEKIYKDFFDKVYEIASKGIANKSERKSHFDAIKEAFVESLPEDDETNEDLINKYFHNLEKDAIRKYVLDTHKRIDNRDLDEIRPIWTEVDYLPSAHGSAIFTRGETQSLTTVTVGTKLDEQMIDGAMISGYNKFILHYNFPGFSTGEVKPNRGPGRREVGHGNLALRALKAVVPPDHENPYTVRIVSDILESNGSSSMATVCAGTLSLMDAGIKIKAPVSGIAMGMISDSESGKYAILSDILGDEDHLGDMDFKVAGTEEGITACQMDMKIDGLSYDLLAEALEQAKKGRLEILNKIKESISEPRADLKPTAPRIYQMRVDKEFIGAIIGPGGKVIQELQKETGATIVIEEKDEFGEVNIFSNDKDSLEGAVKKIKQIVAVPEVGAVYDGVVKSIMPFGAFIEFLPGKDGLLHISEIKWERLESMDGVLEVGEEVKVKLVEVDKKTGKCRLSRKVLLPKPPKKQKAV